MASVVTINRPDVVALIEKAADEMTGGNKTELVATAVRRLLAENARTRSLFGSHPGSVKVKRGVDLTQPVLDEEMDAETGRENSPVTDLLLDTHVALWLSSGDERLGQTTRQTIEAAWKENGRIFLSAVSVWEIAMLVDKGFIELDLPVTEWVERFLDRPGLEAVALDHAAAARAYNLHHLEHRDPADRLLIASAIGLGCPLVTHDDRIRRFAKTRGRQYQFSIA